MSPNSTPASQRYREREHEDDRIDRDLLEARQAVGSHLHEHSHGGPREPCPEHAAEHAERHALAQQLTRRLPPVRAERRADGQFLLPTFRAHQEQVRHVGARDEQHDAYHAEQHPQHRPDVADHVERERPHVRPELDLVEHLQREARRQRESCDDERDHARDVVVGLGNRHAGLQARHSLVREVADEQLGAVELSGIRMAGFDLRNRNDIAAARQSPRAAARRPSATGRPLGGRR